MVVDLTFWIGFNVFVVVALAVDLGVVHRKAEAIGVREALIWSGAWIAMAVAFNVLVWYWFGLGTALEYTAGYVIEKSLSVDNLFVFLMIFSYFGVAEENQHKVLFWGILGAVVFRAIFIFGGIALLERFAFLIFVFGGFLIVTGARMALHGEARADPERNLVIRLFERLGVMTEAYDEDRFLTRVDGRLVATPLMAVLVAVELTDVVFALDSIPAILAITREPFVVYTSNVFAILGLRALYFALAGVMDLFHYLQYGLAAVLVFVGAKMIAEPLLHVHVPVAAALGVVGGILAVSILASRWFPPAEAA